MQKSSVLSLLLLSGLLMGCPSNRGEQPSGVAGRAYVEKEDGTRVLATPEGSGGSNSAPVRPKGSEKDWLNNFELTERSGKLINSESLKGQPYVLSFFFSTCPTICKRQNEKVSQLQKRFKGQPVRLVSITCDPEVDVPEVLSIYADSFQADSNQWLFLTGDMEYLRRVGAEMFFLAVDRRFHAEKLLLVDSEGQIYGAYDWNQDAQFQMLQTDLEAMIKAGGKLPMKAKPPQTPAIDPEDLE
jgi:protein SCO1